MTTILCPTRGGQASQSNQARAIALARERGAELVFLYVSNVQFLNHAASAVLVDVQREMDEMGEFMLIMAQERAAKAGIQAATVVRSGVFDEALREVCGEYDVPTVVLGTSAEHTGVTTDEYLVELESWIVQELGVEVYVTHEGKDVAHHLPAQPPPRHSDAGRTST